MINKAILLGSIVNKESRFTKDGKSLCTITVETHKRYMDQNGKDCDESTWHIVNFFDRLGDAVKKNADVNDIIYVEGEMMHKKIDDNGINRIVHSIKGNHMYIVKSNEAKLC